MNSSLIDSYNETENFLNNAKKMIEITSNMSIKKSIIEYEEYITHNELELAANVLEKVELYTYEENKKYLIQIINAYFNMELYTETKTLIDRLEELKNDVRA